MKFQKAIKDIFENKNCLHEKFPKNWRFQSKKSIILNFTRKNSISFSKWVKNGIESYKNGTNGRINMIKIMFRGQRVGYFGSECPKPYVHSHVLLKWNCENILFSKKKNVCKQRETLVFCQLFYERSYFVGFEREREKKIVFCCWH